MSAQNVPVTPRQTSYTDGAQALVDQIRAMREQIPDFRFPASKEEAKRLVTAASVSPQFIELVAVAITHNAALARGGSDPARLRDRVSYSAAYNPVADELEALAYGLRHSTTAAMNEAGSEALTIYAMAQLLAKRPETADLAPHVEDMRRALTRFHRKPKSKPAPPPADPSDPTQPSPASPPKPS